MTIDIGRVQKPYSSLNNKILLLFELLNSVDFCVFSKLFITCSHSVERKQVKRPWT